MRREKCLSSVQTRLELRYDGCRTKMRCFNFMWLFMPWKRWNLDAKLEFNKTTKTNRSHVGASNLQRNPRIVIDWISSIIQWVKKNNQQYILYRSRIAHYQWLYWAIKQILTKSAKLTFTVQHLSLIESGKRKKYSTTLEISKSCFCYALTSDDIELKKIIFLNFCYKVSTAAVTSSMKCLNASS